MNKEAIVKVLSRVGRWIVGFIILSMAYLVGDFISKHLPFPVPGSVIGLILIFILLYSKIIRLEWVDDAAGLLLAFLGLFYVPYGVGIIEVDQSVKKDAGLVILLVAIVILTVQFFTGRLFTFLGQKKDKEDE